MATNQWRSEPLEEKIAQAGRSSATDQASGDEPMADPLEEEIAKAGWLSAMDQARGDEPMVEPLEEEIAQSSAAQKMDGACVSSTTNQAGCDDMSFTQEEEQESHP